MAKMRTGAQLLADARRQAGLTQVQLAKEAGIPQSTVSAYERGVRQPTLPTLARLVAAAGFSVRVDLVPLERDTARNGRVLVDLLELVDRIPVRPRGELTFPRLDSLSRR